MSVIPIGKLNNVVDLGGCEGSVTIEEKTVMSEESEINSSSSENSLSTASENSSEPPLESVSENSAENSGENISGSLPEAVESSPKSPEVSSVESITESSSDVSEETAPEMPKVSGDTLLTAIADPKKFQTLYIWEDGNMPATTDYTVNYGGYADDPDFRPYIVTFPVPEGTPIKGAVLINAGGAFQYRSDQNEGTPVAQELTRGYGAPTRARAA